MASAEIDTVREYWEAGANAPPPSLHEARTSDLWSNLTAEPGDVDYIEIGVKGLATLSARPKGASAEHMLLCLHGGFFTGSRHTHRKMHGHIAQAAGCHALIPRISAGARASVPDPGGRRRHHLSVAARIRRRAEGDPAALEAGPALQEAAAAALEIGSVADPDRRRGGGPAGAPLDEPVRVLDPRAEGIGRGRHAGGAAKRAVQVVRAKIKRVAALAHDIADAMSALSAAVTVLNDDALLEITLLTQPYLGSASSHAASVAEPRTTGALA